MLNQRRGSLTAIWLGLQGSSDSRLEVATCAAMLIILLAAKLLVNMSRAAR